MEKREIIKRYLYHFLLFFLFGITVIISGTEHSYADAQVIRVGFTQDGQMIRQTEDAYTGYGVEYLDMIADYTGWQYEYVMIPEEDRLKALEDGVIDLLCDVSKDETGTGHLLFSEERSSLYYGLLCAKKDDTSVFFDDYEAMNGKRIALNSSRSMESMLTDFSVDHQINYTPVYYPTFLSMKEALDQGEVDLMLASNQRNLTDYKYVAKVGVKNQFFAVSQKREDLKEQLDYALRQITVRQPFMTGKLYEENYGRPSKVLTGVTREEYEFLHSGIKVRVVCDAGSYPLGYKDEETGEYCGIYADVLKLLEEKSGLEFELLPIKNYGESGEMLRDGKADMTAGMYINDALAKEYGITYSDSYMTIDYAMIGRRDTRLNAASRIAVPQNYIGIQVLAGEIYPESEVISAKDVTESLKMVQHKEADSTLINSVFLQTAYNLNDYDTLMILPMNEVSVPIRCAIGGENAEVLKQIINRAINTIPSENFERCITENVINISYQPSLKSLFKQYFPYIIGIILLIGSIFVALLLIRERHYKHLAMTDSLTGLWNGIKFRKEAEQLLQHNPKKEYQLISLDIEHFKYVNSDLGEAAADGILKMIGKRLCEVFGSNALYGREMADMFWILTEKREDLEELLHKIAEPVMFENNGVEQIYNPLFKFGICMFKEYDLAFGDYIDMAIMARKSIKENPAKMIEYYDDEMAEMTSNERRIEKRMDEALKNGEFVVYYQPKYQLRSETISGAEALVRWRDPEKGLVSPGIFIPIFERDGFIIQLDFFVYEEVLKDMVKWQNEGRRPIIVSMNVSRAHIGTADFLQKLTELVDSYGVPRNRLELELTETVLGGKRQDILSFIVSCKRAGFQISIDDFGSGYSSLNLLKELPVDVLKIDREFLNETEESEKSSIIVKQVVEMAAKINIETLCEGVETRGQADFLKQIGCDMAQGFLYSRPVPREEFEGLLEA